MIKFNFPMSTPWI